MKTIERRWGNLHMKHWMAALLAPCSLIILPALVCSQDALAETQSVPLFLSASNDLQQGFVRVINHSDESGEVVIHAVDDSGRRFGPVRLALDAGETKHFNSNDLETGNPGKGLAEGIGGGQGDWRLEFESDLDIEVLAYVRTADGFLTSMHDLVPEADGRHRVAIFNPGSNRSQESRLRLINSGAEDAEVAIRGLDDAGAAGAGEVCILVPAGEARMVTAPELESGHEDFAGRLGDGTGKWRLSISTSASIQAMSLLRSPTGHLTNLSTRPLADFAAAGADDLNCEATDDAPVEIPDINLRAVIQTALGKKPGETISAKEMAALAELDTGGETRFWKILNLTGLEYATGLRELDLSSELISDLSPLSGLASLQSLYLNNNRIADLSPLSDLTGLRELGLGKNLIVDLFPLSGLTNLQTLNLSLNYISDLSPLSGLNSLESLFIRDSFILSDISGLSDMPSLRRLFLGNNAISDISGLRDMPRLWRLELANNAISDISRLSDMPHLLLLDLDDNAVSDLSPLTGITGLALVELNRNNISDLSPLSNLTNLRYLELEDNAVSDLSPLSGMTRLHTLNLSGNIISDLSPLSNLLIEHTLDLSDNAISDMSPLSGMPRVFFLHLSGNEISDLSPPPTVGHLDLSDNLISDISLLSSYRGSSLDLKGNEISDLSSLSGLTRLTFLDLRDNAISNLSPISGLTRLGSLLLNGNAISNLSPLSGMARMFVLELSGNKISDLSPLSSLTDLSDLYLEDNAISDLSPLSALPKLGYLDLSHNPLNERSKKVVIPALMDRGVGFEFIDFADPDAAIYNDNVLVMNVGLNFYHRTVNLNRSVGGQFTWDGYAREFYRWFEDAFDYLIFVNNWLPPNKVGFAGEHVGVSNTTKGLGFDTHYNNRFGSAGKLKGTSKNHLVLLS